MLAAAVGGGWAGVVGVATTECIANKQLLEATLSYRPISSKAAKHWFITINRNYNINDCERMLHYMRTPILKCTKRNYMCEQ